MLILGLGNPGLKYEASRHNLGFKVVDALSGKLGIKLSLSAANAVFGQGNLDSAVVYLAKPMTFMNLSGKSATGLLKKFELNPADLLVIHDDLDLPAGEVRVKFGGGAGGHNGLNSTIESLDSQDFGRVRIGIGRPPGRKEPADYVLEDFAKGDLVAIEMAVNEAAEAALVVVKEGYEAAMNRFNATPS
ncbi:MAG: aminoacyl-tRNA hydrolase [Actinomycetota bacterium]|nr:aminoacyl-tRNA hydrolase [Actinomycetota bacterium]